MMRTTAIPLSLSLLLSACGPDPAAPVEIPSWAQVAPEQIAEAKKHGVPVAFENDLGMRFVLIPAGTFLMGSPEDEEGRSDDETQHEVTITKPFYMSICEVTNGQYREFRASHDSGENWGHSLNDDDQPVADVAWTEVQQFVMWLSDQDSLRTYRLPWDEEWEYASRAGTHTRYWWGDGWDEPWRYENYYSAALGVPAAEARQKDRHVVSAPVGSYAANPWGLFDVQGNVAEWCADSCGGDGHGSVGRHRVVRGGCWVATEPFQMRSAFRCPRVSDQRYHNLGFRLVSPLPEPGERGR